MSYEKQGRLISLQTTVVILATLLITALAGLTASALSVSVAPSQEFGKTMNHGQALKVEPVHITSFSQIQPGETGDIQPALGYNLDQRTYNPQQ